MILDLIKPMPPLPVVGIIGVIRFLADKIVGELKDLVGIILFYLVVFKKKKVARSTADMSISAPSGMAKPAKIALHTP